VAKKQTRLWTTADGAKIRLCDMGDGHLLAARRMLDRRAEARYHSAVSSGYSALGFVSSEAATDAIESGLSSLESEGPEGMLPEIAYAMDEEIDRRGLNPSKEPKAHKISARCRFAAGRFYFVRVWHFVTA
jgi:hypothetical protein